MPRDFIDDATVAQGFAGRHADASDDAEARWRRFEALMRADGAQAEVSKAHVAPSSPLAAGARAAERQPAAAPAPQPTTRCAPEPAALGWRRRFEGALLGAALAGAALYLAGPTGGATGGAGALAAPVSVALIAAPVAPQQTVRPRRVANVDGGAPEFQRAAQRVARSGADLAIAPAITALQRPLTAPAADVVVGVPPEGGVPTPRPSPLRTALEVEVAPTRL